MNLQELLNTANAFGNIHRLRIINELCQGRKYVSELSRTLKLSRPLIYLHLNKLEKANILKSNLEISDDGKTRKYYELNEFEFLITADVVKNALRK